MPSGLSTMPTVNTRRASSSTARADPGSEPAPKAGPVSGRRGYLWHALWHFRSGDFVDLRRFRRDVEQCETIVFVCSESPHSLDVPLLPWMTRDRDGCDRLLL